MFFRYRARLSVRIQALIGFPFRVYTLSSFMRLPLQTQSLLFPLEWSIPLTYSLPQGPIKLFQARLKYISWVSCQFQVNCFSRCLPLGASAYLPPRNALSPQAYLLQQNKTTNILTKTRFIISTTSSSALNQQIEGFARIVSTHSIPIEKYRCHFWLIRFLRNEIHHIDYMSFPITNQYIHKDFPFP